MKYKKILVCDDDEGILEMLELLLEEDGYQVVLEPNSVNALRTIERESPDLILLDIWMPMISGDQILKSLRDNHKASSTPVLMYSASTDGKNIAESCGADSYISKPFDLTVLLKKIEGLLQA
ncbi:PleD family two-component system response regulator [Pedobacter vanadiisoli]|uniref:PleD family two-component system response regulator n=1 Tax=Pedobacter vanadiisoli TaxID=1761975 RepID=A0ABW5MPQ1_9SPHI